MNLRGGVPTYPPKLGSNMLQRQHSLPAHLVAARRGGLSPAPLAGRPPPLRRINAGHSAPSITAKIDENPIGRKCCVGQTPLIDVIPASRDNTPEVCVDRLSMSCFKLCTWVILTYEI